jgi:hypothetical protein
MCLECIVAPQLILVFPGNGSFWPLRKQRQKAGGSQDHSEKGPEDRGVFSRFFFQHKISDQEKIASHTYISLGIFQAISG